jgi:hypothetical protein
MPSPTFIALAGLHSDLQGIAGRAMPEIESLDVLMIEEAAPSG